MRGRVTSTPPSVYAIGLGLLFVPAWIAAILYGWKPFPAALALLWQGAGLVIMFGPLVAWLTYLERLRIDRREWEAGRSVGPPPRRWSAFVQWSVGLGLFGIFGLIGGAMSDATLAIYAVMSDRLPF